ncbi:MAG: thiazole synthase [Rickettsiales bacterium]|jgi:thiazole synthase|nr:thiazole synthase [Rickettsiales bacterium]MDA9573539.1 thiazole synthase [Rickettsiales bacterium]|tara:strand:- start:2267 stop:3049 length:783 start_codon:yes stop_codon:yes gene_type:complete
MNNINDLLYIAGKKFNSRLLIGTGKYKNYKQNKLALEASEAEIITVAVRRVNIDDNKNDMLQDYIDPTKYTYLPNSAGCFNANDAIRTLRLARAAGGWNLVKLEILSDDKTLYPKVVDTISAAKKLIDDDFEVMVYTSDDPIVAKELEDIGCCAIMPLAAPIGSGLGIQNKLNIELIISQSNVPVLIDAGVGTASDAAIAMEMGCDGVLMNSAIALAKNPLLMAQSMKYAIRAGRLSFLAGRMKKNYLGSPSSPIDGKIT